MPVPASGLQKLFGVRIEAADVVALFSSLFPVFEFPVFEPFVFDHADGR
jgi:hypothetical protein